jgi:hypothetical protein
VGAFLLAQLGGGLISTLIGLIVFLVVVGILLRMLGWWGGAPNGVGPAGPGWGGMYGPVGGLIGLIVFLVVLGVLLRILGVWV